MRADHFFATRGMAATGHRPRDRIYEAARRKDIEDIDGLVVNEGKNSTRSAACDDQ